MLHKRLRHAALLRLVRERPDMNQAGLARLLTRSGFHATQASISRDVRELGLIKVNGRYLPVARLRPRRGPVAGLTEAGLITSVEPVGANLVVVRTRTGGANAVAVELDARRLPEVAGTVAGDDTIFIAVRSRAAQGRLVALLSPQRPVRIARPAGRGGERPDAAPRSARPPRGR
ncbi:MAG: arginine repressor [Planctomycetota bacterium]